MTMHHSLPGQTAGHPATGRIWRDGRTVSQQIGALRALAAATWSLVEKRQRRRKMRQDMLTLSD